MGIGVLYIIPAGKIGLDKDKIKRHDEGFSGVTFKHMRLSRNLPSAKSPVLSLVFLRLRRKKTVKSRKLKV